MKKLFIILGFIVALTTISSTEISNTGIELPKKDIKIEKYADFRITFDKIIKNEGYYANHPNDKGKETYCGITRKYNPDWYGWRYIDQYKRKHRLKQYDTVPGTKIWVTDFYVNIWVNENYFYLKNQQIADYLFDFRIHYTKAVSIAQSVLNDMGYELLTTNKLDENTINTLNSVPTWEFLSRLMSKRLDLYLKITDKDKSQTIFLRTWVRRSKTH